MAAAFSGGLAVALAGELAAALAGEFGASPRPGGTWLSSSPGPSLSQGPNCGPRVNACYVIIPGGSDSHPPIATMDPGEVAGQPVPVWPLRRRARNPVGPAGRTSQLLRTAAAGSCRRWPGRRNGETVKQNISGVSPRCFADKRPFRAICPNLVEPFANRDMIAKLFRPMRMNILRYKKCFRDRRSRVPFGVTPPGRVTPKAAALASRDA